MLKLLPEILYRPICLEYDSIRILSEMTYNDVQKALLNRFDTGNMTISVIE